ncbi:efflux RND transporter periplasmic adaptor subunit [Alteromonas sp. KUL49]|uniref:efflux RND transporter periplasmic adaptor subunit n=1 Tax=Alteromonas sp. KUL49 TaxID=2480798 RepID=UPI00102EE341|nr:efflux RND transporter periplasmic adaptor subunit [Alteromonas sp. KUL49]TAP40838.1 efflux RND transporter periplasmic adaptor subunit [Alteromonas sp. KUL49]GEA11015.1 copper transporter [Alteromonas sp. KUL49]
MTKQQKNNRSFPDSSRVTTLFIGVAIGLVVAILGYLILVPSNHNSQHVEAGIDTPNKPLYWVAPMDPNFKRDKPGKSPMGMDLVPVYENNNAEMSPGTVSIDPVTQQNLGVKTTVIKALTPNKTITALGEVQYAQDEIEHVHSRIAGWIEVLNVRAKGDFIEKGTPLYSIYSPELVNAQEELVIALRQNNATLINAAKLRLRSLAVPQSQIQTLESTRKVSHTVTFLAPISGYVKTLNIQQGFYVEPSVTMLSIASINRVWVIADVFPNDATMLHVGQEGTITSDHLPGQIFEAQLDYLYPKLNELTRTTQARFVVQNRLSHSSQVHIEQMLKPGMFTQIALSYRGENANSENGTVLGVPKQAVIRSGKNDRVVLSLGEGKFKSINVQLGRDFDHYFEVLDGLVEGDEIVTSAQFLIDSESSITSDFKRMETPDSTPSSGHEHHMSMQSPVSQQTDDADSTLEEKTSAWTEATINNVDKERRTVNLSHGYLDAFNMMGMTMNFSVSERIDINEFKVGAKAHVEIVREDSGMFQVKTLHIMSDVETEPNHHQYDHSMGDQQ